MELNIDNIINLTSIPPKYTTNSKVIEYLYQNNPNIFNNVDKNLILSYEFQEKITKLINERNIILTENNIKLLDALQYKQIIDVLKNNFEYLYLINKQNFSTTSIAKKEDFVNLLKKHQIQIDDKTPYLVTKCGEYIIEQYLKDKTDITNIMPYFNMWNSSEREKLIQTYFDKGNSDLSIFSQQENPIFNDITINNQDDNVTITAKNISSASIILNFDLPFNVTDVYIEDGKSYFSDIIEILSKIKEKNINLHVKNGFSIESDLENNCQFLELCGNVGNIKLFPFEIEDFKKLLLKAEEHPGVVINIDLSDFMNNESFFINLNTDTPINIISKSDVTILSLTEMKQLNQKLDYMVEEIKNSNLSPYEKYIAAYNIVKSFKKYRFYLDNEGFDELISDQSRNPYLVLINQYIVCAGYTALLKSLLQKLNIPSHDWILYVSEKSEATIKLKKPLAHSRLCVNIVDEKYRINGYFMSDPTFDNVSKENKDLDGYQYLSMSIRETHDYDEKSPSYYYFSFDPESFNDQMFINTDEYLQKKFNFEEILEIVIDLDPEFHNELLSLKDDKEKINNAIKKHFTEKTSNSIQLKDKYDAIISVLEFQNKLFYSKLEKIELYEKIYNSSYGIDDEIIINFDYSDFSTPIDFGDKHNNKKR